jgi:hypothetical protein
MDRYGLQGQLGDALYAVLCAAGYNLRWLLWAMLHLGLKGSFLRLFLRALIELLNGNHSRSCAINQDFGLVGALGEF